MTRQVALGGAHPDSLVAQLSNMQKKWVEILSMISGFSFHLGTVSNHINEQSRTLLANGEHQKQASGDMSASIEELSVSLDTMAEAANRVEDSNRNAMAGEELIGKLVDDIRVAAESVRQSALQVTELDGKAAQIASTVSIIHEIADQTNLLALNAAIEAARAGETGRGFAVVADEVRKLAERTSQSTLSIASVIKQMGDATHGVVSIINAGVTRVESCVDIANEALQTMGEIRSDAAQARSDLSHIVTALQDVRSHAHEIANRVTQVVEMTVANADTTDCLGEMVRELDTVSESLNANIAYFKLPRAAT